MSIKFLCKTKYTTVHVAQTVLEAARVMKLNRVDNVVVLSRTEKPVGILTDRDIVDAVVAENYSPDALNVEDVMVHEPHVVSENEGIFQTALIMKQFGVRRLPVVNEKGRLTGVCALDDLLVLFAEELTLLSEVPWAQRSMEKKRSVRRIAH